MTGLAVIEILVGMGGSWLFRELLIKTLRTKHPQLFSELGEPSSRKLSTIIPRYQDMQIQFWKFVWGGRAFRVKDDVVTVLATAILISNIVLAAGVILLLWSVASSAPV
jgi:hypothetical protein